MVLKFEIRIIQKHAMESLNEKWKVFIQNDTSSLYEKTGVILDSDKSGILEVLPRTVAGQQSISMVKYTKYFAK